MKPAPLTPSAAVGLIAPGSAPLSTADLFQGIKHLEAAGLTVKAGRVPYSPQGYLSGTDTERLDEFHQQLRDPDVRALVAVRGGYGCLRLLPHLDYHFARSNPKLLVGYSDITALQLALYARSGWTSLSGPMVAVDWANPDPESIELFWELARGTVPAAWAGPASEPLHPIKPGESEGPLLGGNLTVITRLIGTPYMPNLENAILFVEDVGEAPYRVDGMLAHLKNAGILNQLVGLIFGEFTAGPDAESPTLTFREVIDHYSQKLTIPVASNLIYGHLPSKNTLPIGVRARLEVTGSEASLSILEPVCE